MNSWQKSTKLLSLSYSGWLGHKSMLESGGGHFDSKFSAERQKPKTKIMRFDFEPDEYAKILENAKTVQLKHWTKH